MTDINAKFPDTTYGLYGAYLDKLLTMQESDTSDVIYVEKMKELTLNILSRNNQLSF